MFEITRAWWRFKSLVIPVFIQQLLQDNKKETIIALHYSLCEANPLVAAGFPSQRDGNAGTFPFHIGVTPSLISPSQSNGPLQNAINPKGLSSKRQEAWINDPPGITSNSPPITSSLWIIVESQWNLNLNLNRADSCVHASEGLMYCHLNFDDKLKKSAWPTHTLWCMKMDNHWSILRIAPVPSTPDLYYARNQVWKTPPFRGFLTNKTPLFHRPNFSPRNMQYSFQGNISRKT